MTSTSVVKSCAHARRPATTAIDKTATHARPSKHETHAACLARAGWPAPSSLLTRVFAAMPTDKGGMKQTESVVAIRDIAAKLNFASGSVPARSTVISDAHHSEIIRKFGSARRRKGHQPRNAPHEKPFQESAKLVRSKRRVLKMIHDIRKKLASEVDTAAPTKPNPAGWTMDQQSGKYTRATSMPPEPVGLVTRCAANQFCRHCVTV
mmetsp:Transcript_52849/g.142473  ORF Transcript_52849/g.142473 Transcript_52849/m.142473 type:complete len:208 (+) Transcript_52849:471-1094(+)